jgi:AcrR family transcriptional regulator
MARPSGPSLRAKILEEAIGIVYREGPARVTMRSLATKLGYSPATIYLYFRSKDELLREISDHGFALLAAALEPASAEADCYEAIREIGRRYVDFALEHPELYRLMFQDVLIYQEMRDRGSAQSGRVWELCRTAYARGIESGAFRPGSPDVETTIGWSMVHGFVELVLAERLPRHEEGAEREDLRTLRDALIEERLRALRP